MLELKNINIIYDKKECIRNGDFKAVSGNITGIYGESGTGKSSLLYVIGMLGQQKCVYYYNNELLEYNDKQKAKFRKEYISFITQNSVLVETISVEKNIEFFLSMSDTEYSVDELLEMVNLTDKKNAMPSSLSGGERQRVAIACAIAKDSDIILGDEITSALDEDNKKIVMNLLREYANKGKIVILVSHEKRVLDECDVLYKIDHLKLILEKNKNKEAITTYHERTSKKQSLFKMYRLLFHSNKKIKRRRLVICFLVMIIVFVSASIVNESKSQYSDVAYSLEHVSNRKISVINDHAELLQDDASYSRLTQRAFAEMYQEPFFKEDLEKISQIDHIVKIYDSFIFYTHQTTSSNREHDTSIIATRNGKKLDRKDYINGYDYYVIPMYPEEDIYTKDGVYVSAFFAYIYNLKVGDELDMEIEIPYAMSKTVNKGTFREDGKGEKYYRYDTFGFTEPIRYKTKVVGIIEGNSYDAKEVYMDYKLMETFLYDMIDKKNITHFGEVIEGSIPLLEVAPMHSYSKTVFVDEYENVLEVQNQINDISKRLFAYNEYQSVGMVIEMTKGYMEEAMKMALIGISIFIFGAIVVEFVYIYKYKSIYMIMRLNGYNKREIVMLNTLQGLYQFLLMIILTLPIYITASMPNILTFLHIIKEEDIWQGMSQFYNAYYAYCAFTSLHFILFILLLVLVVFTGNIFMQIHIYKQDMTKWLRGD